MDEQVLQIIKEIVFRHIPPNKYKVFVFGSRVSGRAGKWSDYDIGIEGEEKVPTRSIMDIREALEESDLPYFVDVVDFNEVDEDFKKIAKQKIYLLN